MDSEATRALCRRALPCVFDAASGKVLANASWVVPPTPTGTDSPLVGLLPVHGGGRHARWVLREGRIAGAWRLESAFSRGAFLAVRALGDGHPLGRRPAQRHVRREPALFVVATEADVAASSSMAIAEVRLQEPTAMFPALSFWAAGVASGRRGTPRGDGRGEWASFLAYPLNEVIDEHYAAYACLLTADQAIPPFCL